MTKIRSIRIIDTIISTKNNLNVMGLKDQNDQFLKIVYLLLKFDFLDKYVADNL